MSLKASLANTPVHAGEESLTKHQALSNISTEEHKRRVQQAQEKKRRKRIVRHFHLA